MIPKVLHYCWFGGKPLPSRARKCLESWRRFLPGYEIRRWDETNFDVNASAFSRQAYEKGLYALVSDYARFKILSEHGGLYFDTDVELIKSPEEIIDAGPFMARESAESNPFGKQLGLGVAPGLGMGAPAGHPAIVDLLNEYERLDSITDGDNEVVTVVKIASDYFLRRGLTPADTIHTVSGVNIYPKEYFCPVDVVTGRMEITPATVAIHHYAASWQGPFQRLKKRVKTFVGPSLASGYIRLKSFLKGIR